MSWQWLENPTRPARWAVMCRVALKALILFALVNIAYAALNPLDALGRLDLYGVTWPPRERFTRSNVPAETYSVTTFNLNALFESHAVTRPKAADEFRVFFMGDSSVWGSGLMSDETYAARLTQANLTAPDGRRIVAYNLGYPAQSMLKDLMLLDAAMQYQPDLIIWFVTLHAMYRPAQFEQPIIQNNTESVRRLIATHTLDLATDAPIFASLAPLDRTLIQQRRALADLLRLQGYGAAWGASGIDDQARRTENLDDFPESNTWQRYEAPFALSESELTLDIVAAGHAIAGDVPLLLVNEPIYISARQPQSIRYNTLYPRWAYDSYRDLLTREAQTRGWHILDLWDSIAPQAFTDSPVHITPQAAQQVAQEVNAAALARIEKGQSP